LLWLHDGDTVDEVATRLFVTPRTVCRWRSRFHECQALALHDRLADGPRRGRPKTVSGIIAALLNEVMDGDPRHLGSHAIVWTALYGGNICAMSLPRRAYTPTECCDY
jgi:transposase